MRGQGRSIAVAVKEQSNQGTKKPRESESARERERERARRALVVRSSYRAARRGGEAGNLVSFLLSFTFLCPF